MKTLAKTLTKTLATNLATNLATSRHSPPATHAHEHAHAHADNHGVLSWRTPLRRIGSTLRTIEPHGQAALLLALRLLYGGLLVQTGWGKLINLERTTGFFEGLGLPAPGAMAVLVAGTELVGGVLLAAGLAARFAAAALTTVMLTALATAHAAEALQSVTAFTAQAPYPFLVAALIVLAFGAGQLSVDGALRRHASRRAGEGADEVEQAAVARRD